jgi:CRP/FNR family cyclic AMP-dependent transcriptional regulator
MSTADLLHSVPLFRGLEPSSLERIASHLTERAVAAGEVLFNQGDPGHVLYVVIEGEVEVFIGSGRTEKRLNVLGPGSYLGEMAMLDGVPRSTSARAIQATRLFLVPRDQFLAEVLSSLEASRAMLAEMARRLRGTNQLVGETVARNAVAELDRRLTFSERLADRVTKFNGSWISFIGVLLVTAAWIIVNAAMERPLDPFPYVLFNLLLGLAVTLQGSMLMMSQNRQAQRDRAQAAADFDVNLKNELGIQALTASVARLEERIEQLKGRAER